MSLLRPIRGERAPANGGGAASDTRVTLVSPNYFRVMGVDVAVGRPFVEGERQAVAVISDAFWTRSFGRTPDILAKTVDLNGVSLRRDRRRPAPVCRA